MNELVVLEMNTREKLSRSLSKIEIALADWDQSEEKPKKFMKKIAYLKKSHALFSNWMKKSLKGKKDSTSSRLRLQEFTEICRELNPRVE